MGNLDLVRALTFDVFGTILDLGGSLTPPLGEFLGLNALLLVYLALLTTVTLLASTLVRSAAAAGAIGFGVFVGLSLLGTD